MGHTDAAPRVTQLRSSEKPCIPIGGSGSTMVSACTTEAGFGRGMALLICAVHCIRRRLRLRRERRTRRCIQCAACLGVVGAASFRSSTVVPQCPIQIVAVVSRRFYDIPVDVHRRGLGGPWRLARPVFPRDAEDLEPSEFLPSVSSDGTVPDGCTFRRTSLTCRVQLETVGERTPAPAALCGGRMCAARSAARQIPRI
ncbi:hypothetical protein BV20DRAFT_451306 [Pilatotrama ljubarskyi]|nr:hypothetical protein BV20DRAFT_451306 [Pilatotrama ljubarskyi]